MQQTTFGMRDSLRRRGLALALLSALPFGFSCETFDPPPEVSIEGLDADGVLQNPEAPIRIHFDHPIKDDTLELKIAEFITDTEFNLGDEPGAAKGTPFNPLFTQGPKAGLNGGLFERIDSQNFQILPTEPFPVGPQLVLLIEPGLQGTNGVTTVDRRKTTFSYGFSCKSSYSPGAFKSGGYFFLVDVSKPLGLQLQLYASVKVNPETGAMVAQFTNADRRTDLQCPESCGKTKVCRQLPSPQCVPPSERAGSLEEYPDFYANNVLPVGFSFTGFGCVSAQPDGSVRFGLQTEVAEVQQPRVTLLNVSIMASFKPDETGRMRATGGFNARDILLFESSSGEGKGDMVAMALEDSELPPGGIPAPPETATAPTAK